MAGLQHYCCASAKEQLKFPLFTSAVFPRTVTGPFFRDQSGAVDQVARGRKGAISDAIVSQNGRCCHLHSCINNGQQRPWRTASRITEIDAGPSSLSLARGIEMVLVQRNCILNFRVAGEHPTSTLFVRLMMPTHCDWWDTGNTPADTLMPSELTGQTPVSRLGLILR